MSSNPAVAVVVAAAAAVVVAVVVVAVVAAVVAGYNSTETGLGTSCLGSDTAYVVPVVVAAAADVKDTSSVFITSSESLILTLLIAGTNDSARHHCK
jgi:hypothetical protein